MNICHCGRLNCAGNTPECVPLTVKHGETVKQAFLREGKEYRDAHPPTGWRAKQAALKAEARKATKQ